MEDNFVGKQRLSWSDKNANEKAYYKENIKKIDNQSSGLSFNGVDDQRRMKVNYDLYNNILDLRDFEYVCKPYGAEVGELPAQMINRDICSGIIKAIEGMEIKRAFPWKPVAVNRDATTRKEEEEFGRIKEYVIADILKPIRQEIEAKKLAELQGRQPTEQEMEGIRQEIEKELQAQTPDKVRKYMEREHQDPAEVMSHQILQYLIQELHLEDNFSAGWKHANLSAYEVYYVGIVNDKPVSHVVNSLRFGYDMNPDVTFIEDGSYAWAEYRKTPEEIVSMFPELTDTEIDDIYENYSYYMERGYEERLFDFAKTNEVVSDNSSDRFVRLFHANWKGLRKIGFLTYIDDKGQTQLDFVDESYKLNLEAGDLSIEWEWLEESYEGYRIGEDLFVGMRPVPGQFKDIHTLRKCKLSYYGGAYDSLNSQPTAPMDRMKSYQYYYNIVMYRLELLFASDDGKKIMMNINSIPESAGIDIKQWQYFYKSSPFMWVNPNEEGIDYADVNTLAKQIDMSMVSDISKYIEFAEYLEKKCKKAVGVTDAMLGDISASAEVGNTRQEVSATANILEPMFNFHTRIKQNVLQALIEAAKVAYSKKDPGILSYILDDMSHKYFEIDQDLLDNSSIGIFVTNSTDAEETKKLIMQLAHAGMQNDKVAMGDVIKAIRQTSAQEAEEVLNSSEKRRMEEKRQENEAAMQAQQEAKRQEREDKRVDHQYRMDEIKLEESLKYKREMDKQLILSLGFNENKDMDNDGVPDLLEVARHGVDADIKSKQLALDRDKFEHDKKVDKKKLVIEDKKASKGSK